MPHAMKGDLTLNASRNTTVSSSLKLLFYAASLLLLLASLSTARAQSNTGTILGTVQDPSGAVIPGADITVTNLGTGHIRKAQSDASGVFTIPNLQVGHYSITITHPGFAAVQIADTELQVAQQAEINPVMQLASVGQQVTVIASEVPLLNQASASVGQVIDTKTVQDMPLNGRNFWQLTQLTPGVNYIQGGQNIPTGGTSIRASAVNVDVNGLSPSWTGWYLDGANITEFQLGGTIIQPNVDALQEFKVESSSMGADYGHSPTIINATLRSGTNQFHGTFYDFLRNNSLDSKNYFFVPAPGTNERDEPLHRNQFGLATGGPIWKNKTFFFVDAQSTLFTNSQVFNSVVPSDPERGGDFSASSTVIKDPQTGQQVSYDGTPNVIPPSMITPQAQYLLQFMPHANRNTGNTYNALVTNSLRQQLEQGDLRIDQTLSPKDQLMARYSISNNRETDPNGFPAMGGFPLRSRGQDMLLRETHIFNERWMNEVQASYYRSFFLFTSSLQGQDIAGNAGIQGLEGLAPPADEGFPTVTISNYSTYNGQAGNSYPKQNKIRSYQYVDHLSYIKGNSNLRLGYELFHDADSYVSGSTSTGTFTFNGKYSGDNFADFLMGYPLSAGRAYFRQLWGNSGNFQALYAQDDYHFKSNLTINAGIRWEINPYYNAMKGQTTGFDWSTGALVIPTDFSINAQPGTPTLYPLFSDRFEYTDALHLPENIRNTDTHDVAPRLGFAWSPGANTVIRSGYGMFFLFVDDNGINNSQNSVPFVATQTVNNTTPTPTYTLGNFYQGQPIVSANPNPGTACSFGVVANSCSTPSLNTGDLHPRDTYIQEYNLAVQHQFGQRISLDLAYVGSRTEHAVESLQINDPTPAAGAVQSRRPFAEWGTIDLYHFGGYGWYNALQAKFETRDYHGATLLASYTYGKSLVNGTYGSGTIENTRAINYYGPANYDLTQNFVTSYLYDLPFGHGKALFSNLSPIANGFVDNWNFSGIITVQSGLPYTPTISGDQANTGVGSQRPNVIGKVQIVHTPSCWYYDSTNAACGTGGTNAFALPAKYTYGDGGINWLRADGLIQFDMTLMKTVHFAEKRSLELRGSFYNVFNRPTFSAPSTNIDSSSAGQVTSTLNAARVGELAAKIYF